MATTTTPNRAYTCGDVAAIGRSDHQCNDCPRVYTKLIGDCRGNNRQLVARLYRRLSRRRSPVLYTRGDCRGDRCGDNCCDDRLVYTLQAIVAKTIAPTVVVTIAPCIRPVIIQTTNHVRTIESTSVAVNRRPERWLWVTAGTGNDNDAGGEMGCIDRRLFT